MKKNSGDLPKSLTPDKRKELAEWLEGQQLDVNKVHRDCTDCVLVAKVLKKIYPKMIDLYNYPERNSIKLKLANWTTLNSKVLAKLGMQQKPIQLHKFVNADRDAIEILLHSIMSMHKSTLKQPDQMGESDDVDHIYSEKDAIIVNINKVVGEETVKVPQKMICYAAYEQAMQNHQANANNIITAEQKIKELEIILKEKSCEIDQLCSQLAIQTVITMDAGHIEQLDNNMPTETAVED